MDDQSDSWPGGLVRAPNAMTHPILATNTSAREHLKSLEREANGFVMAILHLLRPS